MSDRLIIQAPAAAPRPLSQPPGVLCCERAAPALRPSESLAAPRSTLR
eukprot:CAMPEP_0206253060 /NCGR_PEP_ID=MMETSP0047_2-20121206/22950_1 /ASSEMBLY_ACC=CAM_ASM_000192 /TAXON_ID=195065 /ORGANISM="Chroomonas mesostigmatica_cf, Strain CCMP1168" /LENGTH=47 /DNA_ID= /DNA_START= /DNA_END= /DNA_ORIENTATION=